MRITLFNLRRSGVTEEELSAYIDGSLDAAARVRIDDRIVKSEELRSRLEALRATVAVLQSAEPLRAPRSFVLTPAMAYGVARPVRGQGFGRISPLMPAVAAAVAAVALGLLLVGNLTGSLRQTGQDTRKATELSLPAQGVMTTQAVMATQGAMPVVTVVVEKERSRDAAVPATPTGVGATPTSMSTPTAFKAAQATAGAESAPPMMAAELAQATATPATVAPAGPQSVAVPQVTPVETPIAAERAMADTEAGRDATPLPAGQGSEAGAKGTGGAATTETAQPADQLAVPGTPQKSPESGLRAPLWQLEVGFAALAAVLGAFAIAMAVQQRRRSS
jgi:hypothetical protein